MQPVVSPPPTLFREVHKHAWLHHVPDQGPGKKTCTLWWVVFCVHCDRAPYLEFYAQPAAASTHQPAWRRPLAAALSVTAGLRPRPPGHRLTVLTPAGSTTLAAPTWEDMQDWVDTLRNKLHEMKILQPRENLYSKPPEQLLRTRAPTRDPTSPLPPPPPGPRARVPGTADANVVSGGNGGNVGDNSANSGCLDGAIIEERSATDAAESSNNANVGGSVNVGEGSSIVRDTQTENLSETSAHASTSSVKTNITSVDLLTNVTVNVMQLDIANLASVPSSGSIADPMASSNPPKVIVVLPDSENISTRMHVEAPNTGTAYETLCTPLTAKTDADRWNYPADLQNLIQNAQNDGSSEWNTGADENFAHFEQNVVTVGSNSFVIVEDTKQPQDLIRFDDKIKNAKKKQIDGELSDDISQIYDDSLDDPSKIRQEKMSDAWNNVDDIDQQLDLLNLTEDASKSPGNNLLGSSDSCEFGASRTANISGMSVCLVDSVLGAANDCDLFAEFDFDDEVKFVVEGLPSDEGTMKRDSKGYTQVNLSTKNSDGFRNRPTIEPLSDVATLLQDERRERPSKPTPAPRSKKDPTCLNSQNDLSKQPNEETNEPFGIYVSLTQTSASADPPKLDDNTTTRNAKPIVAARRRYLLNRTSSVPDSVGTEQILDTYRGDLVHNVPRECSNVTIITLNNQHSSNSKMTQENMLENNPVTTDLNKLKTKKNATDDAKSFREVIKRIEDNFTKPDGSSYVNFEPLTNQSSDDDDIVFRDKHDVTVTTGYGHIRHSTTANKSKKDKGYLNDNESRLVENLDDLLGSGSNAFKIQVKDTLRRQSEGNGSTLTVEGVYESVFTPFTVKSNLKSDVKIPGPQLVVNLPVSPKIVRNVVAERSVDNLDIFGNSGELINLNDFNINSRSFDNAARSDGVQRVLADSDGHSRVVGSNEAHLTNVSVKSDGHSRVLANNDPRVTANNDGHTKFLANIDSRVAAKNDGHPRVLANNDPRVIANSDEHLRIAANTDGNTINVSVNSDSSNAPIKRPNETHESNANGNYEFLSWIRNGGESTSRNNGNDSRNPSVPRNHIPNTVRSLRNDDNSNVDINLNASRNQKKPAEPIDARLRLFTRGLTDLNLISKLRSFNQNKLTQKTVQTSQFFADMPCPDDVAQQGTSAGGKKGSVFSAKLNNMFGKSKNLENVVKTESSLRRNWSEHNDRTQPNVRTDPDKAARVHPSAVPRRPPTNQSEVRAERRRSNSMSSATTDDTVTPAVIANKPVKTQVLSMRAQQVLRLRGEMSHEGGVRLLLRAKDCPEQAVALVDIYGAVWVAGWRQKNHPLLYNALHIGDRLVAVGGAPVSSARLARRALSQGQGQVELIIKRLPHGRVFALKKDSDKQDLGLLLDGGTITGVVANSPAHRAGAPGAGTLTEVNGRPLNLLLKKGDTQVKDRLNSVGRDVSILVQPTEFVSLLRSALKAVRGHKEYIVQ